MDYTNIKVLLTDGGGRQTLTILHGLKEIGCHVTVLCDSKLDVCYASKLPDKKILDARSSSSNEKFESFIMSLVKTKKYDVVLPVAEMSTNRITKIEDEVKKYSKLACAPRESYINAFNKQRTFELALDIGMPCPYTRREHQTIEDFLKNASFPIIIKPRQGLGSIGFHKFDNESEFINYIQEHRTNIDEYVVQEYVNYEKRLGAILVVDQKGNICTSYADEVLRWYPIDAGSACLIRSIDDHELLENSGKLLKAMNWQGLAALSFMVDINTGEPKLLEINGRIPASVRLSWQCGFNVALQLVQMAFDEEVIKYPENKKFGQCTRHTHADFLWFLKSKDRFKAKPSWFSWKKTKDIVYWKHDIKPLIAYTLQKFIGYGEFKKKRQH